MMKATFADLPKELLDQIIKCLPSARDIASLALINHAFNAYIEAAGWSVFARSRFYWIDSSQTQSWRSVAHSLTTVSRAWDRRAFVIRDLEPRGDIVDYPEGTKSETWQAPVGQTMGFVPQIDVYERHAGGRASTEILAFSAGAQICIRSHLSRYKQGVKTSASTRWSTYRPVDAREGRDDVTALQLVKNKSSKSTQQVITGTANGDLQLLEIPLNVGKSSIKTRFTTQGKSIQSTSVWSKDEQKPLLAAALGNTQLALYDIDTSLPKIESISIHDYKTSDEPHPAFTASSCRIWTTQFLAQDQIALGIGGSGRPLVYQQIRPTGIDPSSSRMFQLFDEDWKPFTSNAVYCITPLLESEQCFFTGAYDSLVRMHDLRAPQDTVAYMSSTTTDSAVYSILVRGRQTLLAGRSQHEVVHAYDLRYAGKGYHYTDALPTKPARTLDSKWSVYLSDGMGPSRRLNRRRDGSVYSMASSSIDSPHIYMGLQDTILELAATEVAHFHPDPLHFAAWPTYRRKKRREHWNGWTQEETRNVSLYESGRLTMQTELMSAWTNDRTRRAPREDGWPLDSRYRRIYGPAKGQINVM